MHCVERWFGEGFAELHPLLQQLHRENGNLHGQVELQLGKGLAGKLGARLVGRLGIPLNRSRIPLKVNIHSSGDTLHWNRHFADAAPVYSSFQPHGGWPDGYWIESIGGVRLALAVDVRQGGWYWRPLKVWVHGVRVPLWLLPRTEAYKRIDAGRYHFHVGLSLPLLGLLFSYSGALQLAP